MRSKWLLWCSFILLAALLLASGLGPAAAQSSATAKVLVNSANPAALSAVQNAGGVLLVEYGAFSLWRVPETQTQSLKSRAQIQVPADLDQIYLRGSSIDTRPGALPANLPSSLQQQRSNAEQFWMVQFIGPIKDEWLTGLEKLGLKRVMYLPSNAYVVWGSGPMLAQLDQFAAQNTFVQWTGAYQPAYRLEPSLQKAAAGPDATAPVLVTVQFYTTGVTDQSAARLLALAGSRAVSPPWQTLGLTNLSLELPAGQLTAVAGWADVFNVEPYAVPTKNDEVQGQILAGNITTASGNVVPSATGYLAWLTGKGFPTTPSSYPLVAIVDDGIDNGSNTPVHADFYELGSKTNPDRLIFNANCTADASANGVGGHGNLNAGIAAGYNNTSGSPYEDASDYQLGLGISPWSRVAGVKVFANAGSFDASACSNTYNGIVAAAYDNGANFTSNSWGSDSAGAYTASSQAFDALTRDASSTTAGIQEMLHVFSAGNAGSGAQTIGSPGSAKNVLTVGATENVRDEGISDGCAINSANNADDIATFSSRGPTTDSRVKPDIMAPGTHVQGPATQDPAFDGTGVCGGSTAPTKYYPAGQTLYTWSSGTSHSAPAVSGAVSLIWEYYNRVLNPGNTPSPAMLKALVVNTPRYLNGSGTGGTLPSNNQGWGDVNLGALTDGTSHILVDQSQTLGATGATYQVVGGVATSAAPFHVSLVWSDAPGATTGNAYVNNLDLEVTVGGSTYLGNVFSGAASITGGSADVRNNVENVFIPAGVTGEFTVRVIATNIAGDGLPGNADATDQDFALVIYNGEIISTFTVGLTPATQSICIPANASVNVAVGSVLGYSNSVTLAASGNPATTTTSFSVNPVTPPGSSVLTIGSTGAAAAGSYTLTVSGTAGVGTKSATSALTVNTIAPAAPVLTAPAHQATGQAATPTFTWAASAQAATYDLEIATDAGFTHIVHTAAGLTGTSYSGAALSANTIYYWRVRAANACGGGSYSSTFRFTTLALATDCAVGTTPLTLYSTGFESGADGWTHSGTGDTWALSSANPFAGTQAWHANNPAAISDQRLVSPSISLPSGQNPLLLKFWHAPFIEQQNATSCYDGGILEVSSDGGTLWNPVLNASLVSDPYTGLVNPSYGNPVGGLNGWCATTTTYRNAVADVSSYAGQTVQFRFRLGTDNAISKPGWDLDAVSVQACQAGVAEAYADPTDATCGGNSPCYSGGSALQSALNAAAPGGMVYVTGSHTISSSLTCAGDVTLTGSSGAGITWGGAAGSLFTANNCSMAVKGFSLNGANTASAFAEVGTGTVTAYANNLINFASAYSGSGTPLIGHNYWGTQNYAAPVPSGMPAGEWPKRLGAPVAAYAEGSGSATLGGASLSGGSGLAVIVSFGRGTASAPFTNGVAGHVDAMCSVFYDYFTLGGSGSWTLRLPVDTSPAGCVTNTLNQKRLLKITDLSQCAPANTTCWDGVAGAVQTGSDLTLSGLTAADLGGTHFVASDVGGWTPTAVGLNEFGGREPAVQFWLVLVLLSAALALVWHRFHSAAQRPSA